MKTIHGTMVRGVRACLCASFVCALFALVPSPAGAQNAIQTENAGAAEVTPDWLISDADYAANGEIEGYASAASVNRGEPISLFVQSGAVDAHHTVEVFRVGWYGGAGGRRVAGPITRARTPQPACPITDPASRLVECNWSSPFVLVTGADWTSGVYLAKLTASTTGKQSYIIFVVRDDARAANILFQTSVTTYAAWNNWGGYNYYASDSIGGLPATRVSFDRPYRLPQRHMNGKGAGDFLSWEINMLRFVEREGFDVKYATSLDTHTAPSQLLNQRMFMSVGHDAYYSKPMYDAVEAARDAGVHLGFFGAGALYWQVRFENSSQGGRPDRVMVGYRYTPDPVMATTPSLATYPWRESDRAPVNRPESGLIGVMHDYGPVSGDIVMADCPQWICAGSGAQRGTVLRGLLGHEVNRIGTGSPLGTVAIASSPYDACLDPGICANVERRFAHMSYYAAASGAGVFATGSMRWNWGLDAFNPGIATPGDDRHDDSTNQVAQAITRNVLARFSSGLGNLPPRITSKPVLTARSGSTYFYDVDAIDPNNEPVFYSLLSAPARMFIDPASGAIYWNPNGVKAGPVTVAVSATDFGGLSTVQSFVINVKAALGTSTGIATLLTSSDGSAGTVGAASTSGTNTTFGNGVTADSGATGGGGGCALSGAGPVPFDPAFPLLGLAALLRLVRRRQ